MGKEEKTVYLVTEDGLGFGFVAENEDKVMEYAKVEMDIFDPEFAEINQSTDEDGNPIILPDREFGDKIGLEEGLHLGVYSFVKGLYCERCDTPSEFFVEYEGKIICDKCEAELKEEKYG